MREKLLKLMKSQKLSSSRLAEILEIQPSSISHILSGRNKPSFDFLVKILRRFPTLNPDWLLLDSDQMYRTSDELTPISTPQTEMQLTSQNSTNAATATRTESQEKPTANTNQNSTNRPINAEATLANLSTANGPSIERVIVLYSDKSFEAFNISSK